MWYAIGLVTSRPAPVGAPGAQIGLPLRELGRQRRGRGGRQQGQAHHPADAGQGLGRLLGRHPSPVEADRRDGSIGQAVDRRSPGLGVRNRVGSLERQAPAHRLVVRLVLAERLERQHVAGRPLQEERGPATEVRVQTVAQGAHEVRADDGDLGPDRDRVAPEADEGRDPARSPSLRDGVDANRRDILVDEPVRVPAQDRATVRRPFPPVDGDAGRPPGAPRDPRLDEPVGRPDRGGRVERRHLLPPSELDLGPAVELAAHLDRGARPRGGMGMAGVEQDVRG